MKIKATTRKFDFVQNKNQEIKRNIKKLKYSIINYLITKRILKTFINPNQPPNIRIKNIISPRRKINIKGKELRYF